MSSQPNNFTASDIVTIIKACGESNVEEFSISDLCIKFKSKETQYTQANFNPELIQDLTPDKDLAPSYDEGSLLLSDPMTYEDQAMEG